MIVNTPPMGWNTWNTFGETINEQIIRESVDTFVKLGLRDAGYQYPKSREIRPLLNHLHSEAL